MDQRVLPSLGLILLLCACSSPVKSLDPGASGPGRVSVILSPTSPPRTIVSDFVSDVRSIEVTLVSTDGFPTVSDTDTASPWEISFADVPAGHWNVDAVARNAANQAIGSGSATNQLLAPGASLTIPLTISYSSAATTGDVGLTVSLPTTTGITTVTGVLVDTGDSQTRTLVDSGGTSRASFSFPGLSTGTKSLVMTFRRSTGNVAGIFREKVVVQGGLTSGAWVSASNTLVAERTFAATDFFETNTTLSDLTVSGGVLNSGAFSSETSTYLCGAFPNLGSVTFSASTGLDGQRLQYSWNSGAFQDVASSSTNGPLSLRDDTSVTGTDNILEVLVTAPDGQTKQSYYVEFARSYAITYDANGGTGAVPVDAAPYEAGVAVTTQGHGTLARSGYAFTGWTVGSDPTVVAAGSNFSMPAGDTVLHAAWEQAGNITVTLTFNTPTYGAITFTSPGTVARGATLTFTTALAGATNWNWYVDNVLVSHVDPPFAWIPTVPGQYIIDVDATLGGQPCTGSMRVTVTD